MKGKQKLLYKTSYAEEDYKKCDILKAKVKLTLPRGRTKPHGILTSKKTKTVRDLFPKVPSSRRDFSHSLPDCDTSPDLLELVTLTDDWFGLILMDSILKTSVNQFAECTGRHSHFLTLIVKV